jgi:MSHA pilin protein MshC
MVELVVIIVLAGILAAVATSRFFSREGYDASAYAEQVRAMARYAQKLAIAQNRNVYVEGSLSGVGLCYKNTLPCATADQVPAPSGSNSGNAATRAFCAVGGVYASTWYCEGLPTGVTMAVSGNSLSPFYFNGLGRPYTATDTGTDSTFADLSITLSADGGASTIAVSKETGYVN